MIEAIVYGLVQGLTEFLPISSTAHLRVVPALLGWGDRGAAFTAVIQLGTLVAVFIYFRHDVVRLFRGFLGDVRRFRYGTSADARMAWMIAGGTVPVVICGLLFKKQIEGPLRRLDIIAWAAILFALLLWASERYAARRGAARGEESIRWFDALFIGAFQALALIPGASRSGVTITAGLFVGLARPAAARFSFLLSLPSILAAGLKELYDEWAHLAASSDQIIELLIACVVSGVVGYASIAFLLAYLKKNSTYVFIIYRLILGAAMLVMLQAGWLKG